MNPLVTGIIPVHNHRDWVVGSIDSMARQKYEPLRIIAVDDGSTDGSAEAILTHLNGQAFHPNPGGLDQYTGLWKDTGVSLCLCRLPRPHGPAFARNIGIKVGWEGTDLFALLDSDDMYLPGKIARSVEVYKKHPRALGCIYSDYDTLNARTGLRLRQYKEVYSKTRLWQECLCNCDSLVTKNAFDRVGLFPEDLRVSEDFHVWLKMSHHFIHHHIPESLVLIRVGTHSSSSTVEEATWQWCYREAVQRAAECANG